MSNMKKIGIGIACAIAVLGGLIATPMVMERVDSGTYEIVQKLDGRMDVLDNAGWQYTGVISNSSIYDISGSYYFSGSKLDGGNGEGVAPIKVIFKDGTVGHVNGVYKFMMPLNDDLRLKLHNMYGRKYEVIVNDLIRNTIMESVIQSATYFTAEEAYSYRKSEFIKLVQDQLEDGIYKTRTEIVKTKNEDENSTVKNVVAVTDKDGNPIIYKKSQLKQFNITTVGLSIKDVTPSNDVLKFIKKKRDANFLAIQQKAEAEKAKQARITSEEQGKADVAIAEAKANVIKKTAVTKAEQEKEVAILQAQQEKEVARQNAEKAKLEAQSTIVKKKAEAEANKLLVKAGLTPLQKATIEKETKIGVAHELSSANVPKIIISGGKDGTNPMSAVGIKYLMDINDKLESQK